MLLFLADPLGRDGPTPRPNCPGLGLGGRASASICCLVSGVVRIMPFQEVVFSCRVFIAFLSPYTEANSYGDVAPF